MQINRISLYLKALCRPYGKIRFLLELDRHAKILDVGCGNNSAEKILSISNNFRYVGIDICDLKSDFERLNNAVFLQATADEFSMRLSESDLRENFDAIISAHNLEHCNDRIRTFLAMLKCLKKGGVLYLSFPSSQSIYFPMRLGTLNYFDDPTHLLMPPDYDFYINLLKQEGYEILLNSQSYRPIFMRTIGFLFEPISRYLNVVFPGTWDYYGFESIIWAQKN
jgi:SAM-dependent methyltransferase